MMDTARVLHVAKHGCDQNSGTVESPLLTIDAAAQTALPGDTVRVHAGIYRERVTPRRGGRSADLRIRYEAAPGANVSIRGSEVVSGWKPSPEDRAGVWYACIPNARWGEYNPFATEIAGDWFLPNGRPHHTAAVYVDGEGLHEAATRESLSSGFWFAEVSAEVTTVWIHQGPKDPNERMVEVNARETVFYAAETGINFITISGFHLCHAATNWAPPTAEQVGLIGTNWSKGWIIEDNHISYSRCVGVTLGKHGDAYDNTSADTADGYMKTIHRALDQGWGREHIGSHIVRNNTISHCEQAGIAGSLGAIFSKITGNTIHDIHVLRFFGGAEQAGIKLHAPIDTLIADNHIYRCNRAMWMDWMTQGTRITRNLCHDNIEQDLFLEVNHGPYVVDHNVLLSDMSIWTMSQGGAFVHNLIGGRVSRMAEVGRETPYHPPSSVEIAGVASIQGGDDRYINNIFLSARAFEKAQNALDSLGFTTVDPDRLLSHKTHPSQFAGNQVLASLFRLEEANGQWQLTFNAGVFPLPHVNAVTSDDLGSTCVSQLPFRDPNGQSLVFNTDFNQTTRHSAETLPGPFDAYPEEVPLAVVKPRRNPRAAGDAEG